MSRLYLVFVERPHPNKAAKTKFVEVRSVSGGYLLGAISWFGRWRQYTFRPAPETTFNPDCLREIADESARLTSEHRASLSGAAALR